MGVFLNVFSVVRYFDVYWDRAYETAQQVAQSSIRETGYIYTTHPFLVSLFLDCPVGLGIHCPNASAVERFKSAVENGWIGKNVGLFVCFFLLVFCFCFVFCF